MNVFYCGKHDLIAVVKESVFAHIDCGLIEFPVLPEGGW